MSQRQMQRFQVMGLVEAGKITLKEAAEKIGRSYRQSKRILKRVRAEGVKGVVHGNMGKSSNNRGKGDVGVELTYRYCRSSGTSAEFANRLTADVVTPPAERGTALNARENG